MRCESVNFKLITHISLLTTYIRKEGGPVQVTKKREQYGVVMPPKIDEYLPGAIQKAVFDAGMKHPAVIYSIAAGAGSGFIGWLFEMPIFYLFALIGVLSGSIWAAAQIFFFHEKIGAGYIKCLNERQKEYEQYTRNAIRKGLEECKDIKGFEDFSEQGIEQFNSIRIKLANIKELLEMKIGINEFTFSRFQAAADQVSLSVLDNLKDMVSILKSAGSIDSDYIRKCLHALAKRKDQVKDDISRKAALKKRLWLWKEQVQKVNILLAKNEEALTEMEKISAAVAKWHTDGRFADTDFESALSRLRELAMQAHEYNYQ